MAGKRNSQVVAAILNNFKAVNNSIETMQNSAGNAEQEMGVIMDSIEYKTNRLKETAVGIAQDIFQRDSTKNMVDNLTSLLEVINTLTKSVGGLGTALAGLMAYKGFKGQGIFDIFGAGASGVKGIKNFFTQPVLTKFATNAGLTMADVDALKAFNQQLSQGVTVSRAFEQTMTGSSAAAQSMATSVASGNVAVSQLSVQSRAAAVGMGMLNAAMNVGITLAISWGITQLAKKLDELIVTEEEARQQHEELMQSIKNNVEQHNAEQKEIQSLIQEYSKYSEYTTYTAEQKEQLKSIQDQLIDTYGLEAEGIDLVNGKYEEQIELLDENARKKAKENNANLWTAYDESRKGYDNNSGYSFTQTSETKRIGKDKTGYIYNKSELQEAFEGLFEESSKIKRVGYQGNGDVLAQQEITFSLKTVDENGNPLDADAMLEQVLAIQDRIDQIRRMSGMQALAQSKEFLDLQAQVAKWTEHYKGEVEENNSALNNLAKNLALTTAVNIDGVDYYADTVTSDIYNEFSKKLIGAYSKTEPEVAEAIAKYLDDTYGKAFGEVSLSRMEVEVKKAEEYRQRMLGSTFDYEDYKDKIEEVEKTVSTLSSAYKKLDDNTATASDLGSLFKEFPDLAKYSNDVDTLKEKVRELNNQNVTGLIKSFVELKAKISDPEQLAQLNGWINYLLKLGDLTSKVKEQVSADDYIKYEENNIQNIIDKLEKEKDAQNDILDSLKEQKEELEQIISEYEKTVTAVEKYIDRTQIKPLEQQKSDVEEYYNTQIEKLKEENEERNRNIELQEKQDALANARKTKVRVFSETQGWHYENDVQAIQKAEKELDDLQSSMAIENLEKARDSEVKEIEKQIKSWEKYKDAWKEQVEQINETDEELIASKILGADWQEKISEQNIDVMTNFSSEYVTYNNRLKNQVNVEIANLERVIKSREKEINDWKDYKNQLSDINKNITDSNSDYLRSLNQFVIDENSTWEQRIKHMERNAQIIAKLNGDTNELPETDAQGVLAGSKMWSITKGNEILGLYTSKAEAELNKKKVVEDLVRKQIAPGMPSSIIEVITKRIMETLQIKQYARGGVNNQTGLAWLDGTNTNNEVVFNSAQAKYLYNIVRSGEFGNLVANNILNGIKSNLSSLLGNKQTGGTVNSLSVSFPNAVINAKDYDTFKGFMDRYTNDLLLKMQVGL